MRASHLGNPLAQGNGPFLIGLKREAEPAPVVREQLVVGDQRLEHIHLQFETFVLFRIDGEVDVGFRRH